MRYPLLPLLAAAPSSGLALRRSRYHHAHLARSDPPPAALVVVGDSVNSQLVPSNPVMSSVYLLSASDSPDSKTSVRIPPNWSFSIAFERTTFISPSSSEAFILYSARLSSGDPLPWWLTFYEYDLYFGGVAPFAEGAWDVQLCGELLQGGGTVCEGFEVVVSASARAGEVLAGSGEVASEVASSSSVGVSSTPVSTVVSYSSATTPTSTLSLPTSITSTTQVETVPPPSATPTSSPAVAPVASASSRFTPRDKKILGIVLGTAAGIFLLWLLLHWYVDRVKKARATSAVGINTPDDDDDGLPPLPLSNRPSPQRMARNATLKEIPSLQFDTDRMAFRTSGGSTDDCPSPSTESRTPPSSRTLTPPSVRTTTPSEQAIVRAVDRILSFGRRVVSGASTIVQSSSSASPPLPPKPKTEGGTYDQTTVSTYLYVLPARTSAAAVFDSSPPSTQRASPVSFTEEDSPIQVPARVSRSRSAYPPGGSTEKDQMSKASWESESTPEWSLSSADASFFSRPSLDVPRDPRFDTPPAQGRTPAAYSPRRMAGKTSVESLASTSNQLSSPSTNDSHGEAVITQCDRLSSSYASAVVQPIRISQLSGYSSATPSIAAPARAVTIDSQTSSARGTVLPFKADSTTPSSLTYDGPRSVSDTPSLARTRKNHTRSFTQHTSTDELEVDDPSLTKLSRNNSSFVSVALAHVPQSTSSSPKKAFSPKPSLGSPEPLPTSPVDDVTPPTRKTHTKNSPSIIYFARVAEPFFLHPPVDLSTPVRGLVRAVSVTPKGLGRLPPWVAFAGGVFEGEPMSGDEGTTWEFQLKDASLERTLAHFMLEVLPASAPTPATNSPNSSLRSRTPTREYSS